MVVEVPGPALLPTASGTVTVTAVWTDSDDVDSDPSEPKSKTMYDPRPPAAVVIPPTLAYTARPDATGRARATLEWTPSTGQAAYRVFFADETTLRAKLEDVAGGVIATGDAGQAPASGQAQAVLDALDAAADAPARGEVWRLQPGPAAAALVAAAHRRAGAAPVERPGDVHARRLGLADGPGPVSRRGGQRGERRVGLPHEPAPAARRAEPARPADARRSRCSRSSTVRGNLQAQLTVTVPVGPTPAARYRIRRATGHVRAGAHADRRPRAPPRPGPRGRRPRRSSRSSTRAPRRAGAGHR